MRTPVLMMIAAASLAACTAPDPDAPAQADAPASPTTTLPDAVAQAADPTGSYERTEPASAGLTLSPEGSGWRAAIHAGGVPNGASTAADCVVHVVGPMTDGRIVGRVVPFNDDTFGMDAADVGDNPPEVTVVLTPTGAAVSDGGAAARYCGLGSDISGDYRR